MVPLCEEYLAKIWNYPYALLISLSFLPIELFYGSKLATIIITYFLYFYILNSISSPRYLSSADRKTTRKHENQ